MDVLKLIRPEVEAMSAYTPILPFEVLSEKLGRKPEDIIKLDANENPYGISPKVREALASLRFAHIYPDPEHTALREAISRNINIPSENIFPGAGADEIIDLILRLVLSPGDRVIDCPPTFGMYSFDTELNGGRLVEVPRREDFSIDVEAIEKAVEKEKPKVIFLTSPNNPTGTLLAEEDLMRLLKQPVLIVVDEAYIEFAGAESFAKYVNQYDNLAILRTFSKRAALAGMRVGYGIFPKILMPYLWKMKQPYNVSVASTAAAIAFLQDKEWMDDVLKKMIAEREKLVKNLATIPYLEPYPSKANFVLCKVVGRSASDLKLALEKKGILIRYYKKQGLQDCIRISVGKPEQTDKVLQTLREL
jgi:histidinol-phosphate aminotransferase